MLIFRLICLASIVWNPLRADLQREVRAMMILGDERLARGRLEENPAELERNRELTELYLELLAHMGDEKKLLRAWESYENRFPDATKERFLIETIAWGLITKGTQSDSPQTRAMSLLAAQLSNDSRGVLLLQKALRQEDHLVKTLAVEFASSLRDDLLKEELSGLLLRERFLPTKVAAIKALGLMKAKEVEPTLEKILTDQRASPELRVAALEAIVQLYEKCDCEKVRLMSLSDRAGLRQLACQLIPHCQEPVEESTLERLLNDGNAEVRLHAYQAIALYGDREGYRPFFQSRSKEQHPRALISAAFALLLSDEKSGGESLERTLFSTRRDLRVLASGALASTGKRGILWMLKHYQTHKDPLVRLNLSMGLIGQREHSQEAAMELLRSLDALKSRLMWKEEGFLKYLDISDVAFKSEIPHFPEAMDQTVRLEVLNQVAKLNPNEAADAIKSYLRYRSWGVSGVAAMLLVSEGDQETVEIVRGLLNDEDDTIKIQAALVLGHWVKDATVVGMLQSRYLQANRQIKERILESLARIGSPESIPFLVGCLAESSQNLRIIAAAALIQCINH